MSALLANTTQYGLLLKAASMREVSIGYTTIRLFQEDELRNGQVGYSIDLAGISLVGENKGDWKQNWLVIGYEDSCGDPLFIDIGVDDFPVYTAMHGMGEWNENRIADSFEGFVNALEIMSKVAVGRENPRRMDENPLTATEKQEAIKKIRECNPGQSGEFWELLLS